MQQIVSLELNIQLKQAQAAAEKYLDTQADVVRQIKILRDENRKANKELTDLNDRAAKGDKEAIELAKLKSKEIAKNNNDIRTLSRVQRELNKDIEASRKGVTAYQKLNKELTTLRNKIKNVKAEGGIVDSNDLRRLEQLDRKLKEIDGSVGQYQRNVGNYRSALGGLGETIKNGLFAAGLAVGVSELVDVVRQGIVTFADFDGKIALLGAIANATTEDLARLESEAKRLGETTFFTASQVAELQTTFARGGFSPDEIIAVTEATLDLAVATGEDLDSAAQVVASSVRGYGLEAEQAGVFTDVLTKTLNRSNQGLSDFAEASKVLAPTAKLLKISVQESSAAIGILADNGLKGTDATTTLSSGLLRLSDGSKKYAKEAERLGITVFDTNGQFVGLSKLLQNVNDATADFTDKEKAATVQRIFGIQATKSFVTLLNAQKEVVTENGKELLTGADALKGFTTELEAAAGTAATAADTVGNTLTGDFKRFTSAFEGFQIRIVESFEVGLRTITQSVTALFTPVGNAILFLINTFKPLFSAFGELVSVIFQGSGAGDVLALTVKGIASALSLAVKVATGFVNALNFVLKALVDNKVAAALLATGYAILNASTLATAAAQLVVNGAIIAVTTAQRIAAVATRGFAAAQAVLNAVLIANPIGLLVVAIGALVIGFNKAFESSETFRAALSAITSVAISVIDKIKAIPNALNEVFKSISQDGIKQFLTDTGKAILKFNPLSLVALAGRALAKKFNDGFSTEINKGLEQRKKEIAAQAKIIAAGNKDIEEANRLIAEADKLISDSNSNLKSGANKNTSVLDEASTRTKNTTDVIAGSLAAFRKAYRDATAEIEKAPNTEAYIAALEKAEQARQDLFKRTREFDAATQNSDIEALPTSNNEDNDVRTALQAFLEDSQLKIDATQSQVDEQTEIERKAAEEVAEFRRNYFKEELENVETLEEKREKALAAFSQASQLAFSAITNLNEARTNNRLNELDEELEQELAAVEGNEEAQQEIREEFAARREQIEREAARERQRIEVIQSIINTASAVVEALPNIPLSILVGIAGAAQTAAIASQQFAQGGQVAGGESTSHANGGYKTTVRSTGQRVELEGDEGVIKKSAMRSGQKFKVEGTTAQIASALNSNFGGVKFAPDPLVFQQVGRAVTDFVRSPSPPPRQYSYMQGGVIPNPSSGQGNTVVVSTVADIPQSSIERIVKEVVTEIMRNAPDTVVKVQDVNKSQDRLAKVESTGLIN